MAGGRVWIMSTYRDRALIRSAIIWSYTHPGQAPTDEDCAEIRQVAARNLLGIGQDRTLCADSGPDTTLSGTPGTPKLTEEPSDER